MTWYARAALCLALALAPLGAAAQDAVSPEEASRRLRRAAEHLEDELARARERGQVDPADVERATRELRGTRVRTAQGEVPLDDALGSLDGGAPDDRVDGLARLAARARGLARAAERAAARAAEQGRAAEVAAPEAARKALGEVLLGPRFRRAEGGVSRVGEQVASWLQRVENWFLRLLRGSSAAPAAGPPGAMAAFFGWLASLLPTFGVAFVAWCLFAALAALGAVIVFRQARRALEGPKTEAQEPVPDVPAQSAAREPEAPFDEARWREEALAAAARGDLRAALRATYQVLLLVLERGGRIRLEKGRTNWEHWEAVRRQDGALARRLEPITLAFDLVWWGRRALERDELATHSATVDEVSKDLARREGEGVP